MRGFENYLHWSFLLASLGGVQAKLDLNSTKNIAVYWGQNSYEASGGKGQGQQSLGYYCDNDDIDVIPMAFDMMINGPGGVPEVDFSSTSADCDVFEGTQLKNCPKIGEDIKTCQQKGKTILLSIGGATYSEGGFKSEDDAKAGAQLIWDTFGPAQDGSKVLRPFGDAVLDGFDFDFEANVQHMAPFANELRALMDKETSKTYFLTAAPQCPYPDASDKEILNGPVSIDAVWVQFYNNYCGVNNFDTNEKNSKYNFEEWDNWAKTVSQNPNVKVLMGVPADTTAASTGYVPASKLADVIAYSKKFESFGGVMMWDMTQAYANQGFLEDVRQALSGPDSGSSSSSSSNEASTPTSAPSSTNTPETSLSSNAPGSSSSSSSSSASGSSSATPEDAETAIQTLPIQAPATTTKAPAPKPTEPTEPTKPTKPPTTAAPPEPTTPSNPPANDGKPTKPAKPEPTKPTKPHTESPPDVDDVPDVDDDLPDVDDLKNKGGKDAAAPALLGTDLMGLLNGLKNANQAVHGLTHGLLSRNLRRVHRIEN